MKKSSRIYCCVFLFCFLFSPFVVAKKADFIGVEGGSPAVKKGLQEAISKLLQKEKSLQLLPASKLQLAMMRLTLGCLGDNADCMKKIAGMRGVEVLFHVKLSTKEGQSFATFRKIDGATGTTQKTALSLVSSDYNETAKNLVTQIYPASAPAKKVVVKKQVPPKKKVVAKKQTPPKKIVAKKKIILPAAGTKTTEQVSLAKNPRFWAWISTGVAVAAAGGIIAFGVNARNHVDQIDDLIGKSQQGFIVSYKKNIQPLEEYGQQSALGANVLIGVASAAAVTATVLFFIPKKKAGAKKAHVFSPKKDNMAKIKLSLP